MDGVWRRRSKRAAGETKQVSIKDLAVLDNWLSQLKKCAQRYDLQGKRKVGYLDVQGCGY